MSRITTSSASFSWARAPIRRARSSDVKRPQCSPKLGLIETALPNQGCHRGGHELVDRVSAPDPGRGDRVRLDFEEVDALRPGELLEHSLQPPAREAGS